MTDLLHSEPLHVEYDFAQRILMVPNPLGSMHREVAVMHRATLLELLEYSTSLPTGQRLGKRWKARRYGEAAAAPWYLGEYTRLEPSGDDPRHQDVIITWRPIITLEEALAWELVELLGLGTIHP